MKKNKYYTGKGGVFFRPEDGFLVRLERLHKDRGVAIYLVEPAEGSHYKIYKKTLKNFIRIGSV